MSDIVYIDDAPDELMALATAAQKDRIEEIRFDPTDNGPAAFKLAEVTPVWVFDFFLLSPAPGNYTDENGLSLFQKWKVTAGSRPTTVLVSNALEQAVGEPLGQVERHHIIAQKHGVEWIGEKSKETLKRVIEIADAANQIAKALKPSASSSHNSGTYDAERLCFDVLGAPRDTDWANSAQRQIDRARPPREVPMAPASATARAIVGWLITHVIPYPTFILTDAQAALRLTVSPASFRAIAQSAECRDPTKHQKLLSSCRYQGPLATFLGRRWWRAAIDDFAWHLAEGDTGYRTALEEISGGTPLAWLEQSEPVLLSTDDLVETDDIAEAKDCVRVADEDFPASVDPAWVRIDTARENRLLAAKVVYEDRELLSPTE
jgi:hypothetical protein